MSEQIISWQRDQILAKLQSLATPVLTAGYARYGIHSANLDERLYVRKAISWALRQIGKRRPALYDTAVETAQQIARLNTPSARWIAGDVLRELLSFRRKNERCA